ncbi:hypothetical protein B0T17DRAFT_503578 [Bombardia bombarda]|uniref:Uncharacterized protein n=1 Tax=Bombardia bombarda TaxID=252184 RepID=A0AA40CFZ5_9PEZI|nr:hypothetical protein B0T17DRAFT_503578 [Bombardia bombarda]
MVVDEIRHEVVEQELEEADDDDDNGNSKGITISSTPKRQADVLMIPRESLYNDVKWIEGKEQWVYWKGCNVTVYEKDSEGKRQEKVLDMLSGQGNIPATFVSFDEFGASNGNIF